MKKLHGKALLAMVLLILSFLVPQWIGKSEPGNTTQTSTLVQPAVPTTTPTLAVTPEPTPTFWESYAVDIPSAGVKAETGIIDEKITYKVVPNKQGGYVTYNPQYVKGNLIDDLIMEFFGEANFAMAKSVQACECNENNALFPACHVVEPDGSISKGPFQINDQNWGVSWTDRTTGRTYTCASGEDLENPRTNVECAVAMWGRWGRTFGAWSCYYLVTDQPIPWQPTPTPAQ